MKLTKKEMAWMIAGVLAIGMFLGAALGCFVYLRNAEADGWACTDRGYIQSRYIGGAE